jgi:hypothetical protein
MMLLEVPDLGNVKIGAACGIAPTLRTEREEWGTHFVGRVRVIERPGHPPSNFYAYVKNDPATLSDPFGLCPKQKKCKNCATKVAAAVSSKLGVPVTLVGPTAFPPGTTGILDPNDPGMRNGACNFDFFIPGYAPSMPLGNCGRYSPNFTGIGASLHIVYPKTDTTCNPLKDPTSFAIDETGFYFTAHEDSGYVYSPLGGLAHGIVDVLLKVRHGC